MTNYQCSVRFFSSCLHEWQRIHPCSVAWAKSKLEYMMHHIGSDGFYARVPWGAWIVWSHPELSGTRTQIGKSPRTTPLWRQEFRYTLVSLVTRWANSLSAQHISPLVLFFFLFFSFSGFHLFYISTDRSCTWLTQDSLTIYVHSCCENCFNTSRDTWNLSCRRAMLFGHCSDFQLNWHRRLTCSKFSRRTDSASLLPQSAAKMQSHGSVTVPENNRVHHAEKQWHLQMQLQLQLQTWKHSGPAQTIILAYDESLWSREVISSDASCMLVCSQQAIILFVPPSISIIGEIQ